MEEVEGKNIVLIQIQEYPLKPVATRGRRFLRVAKSNRLLSPQEIAQMHLISTGNSWDALPARDVTLDAIDLEMVKRFVQSSSDTGRRRFTPINDLIELLEKLELVKKDIPTGAAILFFGKRPQSPLLQAQIHCGRFKTHIKIMDDRVIGGTIIDQVEDGHRIHLQTYQC